MNPASLNILSHRLEELDRKGLARSLTSLGPSTGTRVKVNGRECLLMASNDYLGLCSHPRLAQASAQASLRWGSGSGASRLVAGSLDSHRELEEEIAVFKHSETALFLPTGYMTNLAVLTGLTQKGDLIISDELNHASIVDACRLARAGVKIYPHGDSQAAAQLLAQAPEGALKIIATDGVFSMDGDLAPLPELVQACEDYDALLVLDDAHATGVFGSKGKGSLEYLGLTPSNRVVQVGTFSKALGGLGGFVAAAAEVTATMVNRARPFLFSTAPPPGQTAAAREGLKLVDEEPWRRECLAGLAASLRQGLEDIGCQVHPSPGPIISVLAGEARTAVDLAGALRREGVFAPAIRPPTVPPGTSRIRLTVTAAHGPEDVDQVLAAFAAAKRELDL